MAEITLGMASPHAFGGGTPLAMAANRQKDATDRRMNYAELLERAKKERPWLAGEVSEDKMQARYDRVMTGVNALGAMLREAAPDVLVVVGDDQKEQFQEDNMPIFCIFRGETLPTRRNRAARENTGSRSWDSTLWDRARQEQAGQETYAPEQPAAPELGEHLIRFMVDEGFDVAASNRMNPDIGLGHAFTYVYSKLLPNGGIPMLPVMVNTFFPPNNPRPARSFAFGQALQRGIEAWPSDARVAVLASGGLSHTVIDEEMDRALLDGIVEKNPDQLRNLPMERLKNGTSELLNWVIVAGAMEDRDFTFITDYMPSYRTEAGTGNGLAVGYWS
jgi:3-O-methylgallate 3,4-dioxygenase